jgi:hypothetical protein
MTSQVDKFKFKVTENDSVEREVALPRTFSSRQVSFRSQPIDADTSVLTILARSILGPDYPLTTDITLASVPWTLAVKLYPVLNKSPPCSYPWLNECMTFAYGVKSRWPKISNVSAPGRVSAHLIWYKQYAVGFCVSSQLMHPTLPFPTGACGGDFRMGYI